jgi:6-phosphogluconate dehydrogenase
MDTETTSLRHPEPNHRKGPDFADFHGCVSNSGEGRRPLQAAIDEGVSASVMSAALYARFSSCGQAG